MRADKINKDLTIHQYKDGFCYGTDAVLLSAFVSVKKGERGAEIGTGSGIIPILLNYHKNPGKIYAFEIQPDYAELARRNFSDCGYGDNIEVICDNINNYKSHGIEGLDFVFTNPPYMKCESGRLNLDERKLISRHEVHCNIDDICRASAAMLKNGGNFFAVFRPDRLSDMIFALKSHRLEPKELLFVQSHHGKAPNLFLIKAKKDSFDGGLKIHKNLVLYTEGANMTPELEYIYENGKMAGKSNVK